MAWYIVALIAWASFVVGSGVSAFLLKKKTAERIHKNDEHYNSVIHELEEQLKVATQPTTTTIKEA